MHVRDFGLSRAIKACKLNPVIAEIKVYSPKYGDLLRGRDPIEILRAYERGGAVGISYITERRYFKGDFNLFRKICGETDLPVLRKDFITDKRDVELTAEAGGSAVLLIARNLKDKTAELVDFAREHGLDSVVEVHSVEDVGYAVETRTGIIGINNRDIGRLERDDGTVELTARLSPMIPERFLKISESGIKSVEDLIFVLKYSDAALIGTAFMMAEDPEKIVREFVGAGRC